MKQHKYVLLAIAIIFLFAGCDLQVPSSVRIKSDPGIQLSLGTQEDLLSERWDMEQALRDAVEEMEMDGLTLLEREADGPLVIRYNIKEIPLDSFGTDGLDLSSMNQVIPPDYDNGTPEDDTDDQPISISIPAITFTQAVTEPVPALPIPSSASLPPSSVSFQEINGSASNSTPAMNATNFTSLTFETGTLSAVPVVTDASPGLVLTIDSASIRDNADVELVASSSSVNATLGETVDFDMTGVVLPNDFHVYFEITVSGVGTPVLGDDLTLTTSFNFSADTRISAASGIDMSTSDPQVVSGSVPISMPANSQLISGTIGQGEVNLGALNLPSDWSGLDGDNLTETLSMSLYQGATLLGTDADITDKVWSLNGITIPSSADLEIQYTYTAAFSGDDVTFSSGNLTGEASGSITEFSEIVIDATDIDNELGQLTTEITKDLGTDITDFVSSVQFNSPSVEIMLLNQLPIGINMTLTSDVLGLSAGETVNFPSSTTETTHTIDFLQPSSGVLDLDARKDPDTGVVPIAVNLDITLDGYDDTTTPPQLTINQNVMTDHDYTLNGLVTTNLDVTSVVIGNVGASESFPEDWDAADPETGLDLSILKDFIPISEEDGIQFGDINASINATIPEGFNITMSLDAEYLDNTTEPSTPTTSTLLDAEEISSTTPDIDLADFKNLINDAASNIVLNYTFSAAGTTLTMADLGEERSIDFYLELELVLDFTANGDVELVDENGDSLIPQLEEDIFGRSPGDENDEIQEYLDMLKAVSIQLVIENNIGIGIGVSITETTNPPGEDDFVFEQEIPNGVSTTVDITLTDEQIQRIQADDEFIPDIQIYIPDGSYAITTEGNISISIAMAVASDVDYVVEF